MSPLIYGFTCFFLLTLIVLTSIAWVLTQHLRLCKYDINFPCYADWACCADDTCTSTVPIYSSGGAFGSYFNRCLGNNGGNCGSAVTSPELEATGGCNALDYGDATNAIYKNYQPYTGLTAQNYTYGPIYPPEKQNSRNLCAGIPATKLNPGSQ